LWQFYRQNASGFMQNVEAKIEENKTAKIFPASEGRAERGLS